MTLPKPIKFKVERYIGGLSQFKKIDNPIKLSANESALGASPKAIKMFENEKNMIFKYPESDANSLREVLSQKFNIDPKRIICGAGSDQIFDLTYLQILYQILNRLLTMMMFDLKLQVLKFSFLHSFS